ncbi:MAG: hypothetical protein MR711_01115 [Selenomonas sp.]|uniref:hypothetical protein n=1 Tax=Selenomonas sp. TaxID=2053611 RepID=UPI0025D0A4F0|nr:hypothetical protein [Selenomonas sp.]MCI6084850.1 hypothetical protein [Selenomonas sp.]
MMEEDCLVEQDAVAFLTGRAGGDGGGAALSHHVRVKHPMCHEDVPFDEIKDRAIR